MIANSSFEGCEFRRRQSGDEKFFAKRPRHIFPEGVVSDAPCCVRYLHAVNSCSYCADSTLPGNHSL